MARVLGVNHITIAANDVRSSVDFYVRVLGCELVARWPNGAYLLAGETWLALVSDDGASPATGYTHLAFDVDPSEFAGLRDRIESSGARQWQDNWTEGDSIYFCDPSGHQLELHASTLAQRVAPALEDPWPGLEVLRPDLAE